MSERPHDRPPYRTEPPIVRGGRVQMHVYLDRATFDTIERLRGTDTRSRIVGTLIAEALAHRRACQSRL
jgi:hypothetical protein